jgi:hypothetical protein
MPVPITLNFEWVPASSFDCTKCGGGGCFGRLLAITVSATFDGELVVSQIGPICDRCAAVYGFPVVLESSAQKDAKRRRAPSRATRKISQRQERTFAEDHGGNTTLASGGLSEKGDVVKRGQWRCECKFTKKNSMSVKRAVLDKIRGECRPGEFPAVDLQFTDDYGRVQDRWVAIPYRKFEDLCQS